MTIHFAASRQASHSPVARALSRRTPEGAANDNGEIIPDERTLHASLRHFAKFGLNAAKHARAQAETAFFAGDRQSYDWWLGICRTLDKRMADKCVRLVENTAAH